MNIGITGATGFLGSYFIDYLLKKDKYNIWALTRKPIKSANKKLNCIIGNLLSEYDCKEFIKNIDILVHFSHTNTPISSNNDILSDANLNLIPNLTLLESIKKYGKKIHIIYISSGGAIYGESKDKVPFKETDICTPTSSYGIQKLTMESYLKLFSEYSYITSTVLRLSNPYGTLLPSNRKQGLIGVALNKLLNNETFQVYGNSCNVRDYIHLEDMSKAFESCFDLKSVFDIFNIGSGKGHSVQEVLSLIEKDTSKSFKKEFIADENSNHLINWSILDISKAKNELNWQPEIDFETGLKNLCMNLNQEKLSILE